jgi:hypothetical protein
VGNACGKRYLHQLSTWQGIFGIGTGMVYILIKRKKGDLKKMRRGFRGWEVEYTDGTTINEDTTIWQKVPKIGIVRLTLHYDGRRWDIMDKAEYYQKKHASVVPGMKDSFRIESRSVGYYEGNSKVLYTVDEHTGRMKMEVKEVT